MGKSILVYKSVVSQQKETLVSVDTISKETGLSYYIAETLARALAKDNIIKLASICESGETPAIGVINGRAKNPEYFFLWSYRHRTFEKENNI